ncbi:MAG: SDR family oxidoreductase [Spirochaetaceae bacterium]|nr:MAG: SDR family oxidoreductase [Spirochaetaceae bacterium]
MRDLKDTVVVIPGASGGVGRALARKLAEKKARIAIASNEPDALRDQAQELGTLGVEVFSRALDVVDETQVESFFSDVTAHFGRVDTLVNLPGLSRTGKIWEMPVEDYDKMIDVNLKGIFLCCKHFVPHVEADAHGLIVNIGSMAAKRANPNAPMYCTAKAAVHMFSQALALQLIEKGIRVTTMNPGPIDSPFWGDRPVPREKFMRPEDVAETIGFVIGMNPNVVFHDVSFESFLFMK